MSTLLERDSLLAALSAALRSAAAGNGSAVLVGGEAGAGKTTLLEHFARNVRPGRVLWGGCEALSTPRPLGPLFDFVSVTGPDLRSALSAENARVELFSAVLGEVARPPLPVVIVFEDVHWADAATLDLIKYLGRRIGRAAGLLVLSYRDDEPSFDKLRPVFADLPSQQVRRIVVPRLSEAAVENMAATATRSAAGLFAATGGNPFFVTEVLRHGDTGDGVPATVRDAVLGRAALLPAASLEVLQLASLVPRAIDIELVDAVLAPATETIERCVLGGLLVTEGRMLRFRHELARAAVETAVSGPRAIRLHQRILASLSARTPGSVPLAMLAHHAQLAGDAEAVLNFAPAAAREAAARGARREAAAQCRAALAYADRLSDGAHAALLDAYATHCFELSDLAAAIPAREAAIGLYAKTAEVRKQSETLASYAMPLVRALRNVEADDVSRRAIALAEQLPPGPTLAKAYATESYLRMLNRDYRDAIAWGERAIELAKRYEDFEVLAGAYTSVGAALLFVDYRRGCDNIRAGLQVAERLDDGGARTADAYLMLGTGSAEVFEFETAERYLTQGIEFARARDLDRVTAYMESWQALIDVYRGNWERAGERANMVAARETASTNRVTALLALGRLRTRRGDPGAMDVLDEALELALRSGTLQRLAPVCGARAEAAWYERLDSARTKREVERAFDLAAQKGHPWFLGELAFWLWRAGELRAAPPGCAQPYVLQIAGRWQEAAGAWDELGCPYERARALADGDESAQRTALTILDRLEARPLAERVRQTMRSAGIRSVPRGPLRSTRSNAARLTLRESQVLGLVADGCRNAQIALRLSCSSRTIDHHIESILTKLDVATRGEAVAAARRLGLLS